ncbi:MAG: response regulator [Deltaproteobacteria bacterium]|nr:response regulator [Deltaproteobacteria bacterium]
MSKKILLADDSITIQKVISITFASEDYALTIVGDGDSAIVKARELRPDLIMADVAMPGKNGYEVCEIVKKDPALRGTPVLLLAGTFEPLNKAEAERVGADDSIVKPFESQELIEKVRFLSAKKGEAESSVPLSFETAPQEPKAAETPVSEDIWEAGGFLGATEEPAEAFQEKAGQPPDLDFIEGGLFEEPEKEAPKPEAGGFVDLEFTDEELKPKATVMEEPAQVEPPSVDFFGAGFGQESYAPEPNKEEPKAEEPPSIDFFGSAFGQEEASPDTQKQEPFDIGSLDAGVSFEEPSKTGTYKEEGFAPAWPAEEAPQAKAEEKKGWEDAETDLLEVPEAAISEEKAPAPEPQRIEPLRIIEEAAPAIEERAVAELKDRLKAGPPMPKEDIEEIVRETAREVIERIAWDVVPDIAEELITKELMRLKEAWARAK